VDRDDCASIEGGGYLAIFVLYVYGTAVLLLAAGLAGGLGLFARRWPLSRTPISITLSAASLGAIVVHTRWAVHFAAGWSGPGSRAGIERFTAAVGVGLAAALMAAAFLSLLAPRLTALVPMAATAAYVYLALPLAGRRDLFSTAGPNLWLALAAVAGTSALVVFHFVAKAPPDTARS
jgi:hypothetical protein